MDNQKVHPRDLVVIKLLKSIYRFKKNGVGRSDSEFFTHAKFDRIYLEETYFGDVYFYDEITNTWVDGNEYVKSLMKLYGVKDDSK